MQENHALPNERIDQLIGIALAKTTWAAVMIAGVCIGMGVLALYSASTFGGAVFGCLFVTVGVVALPVILHRDGGALRILRRRLRQAPEQVAWLHVSPIPNRLRRRESTLIVFFLDRSYVRLALSIANANELFDLLAGRCPEARQTRDLPLPELLEHERSWRKDPEAFRSARDEADGETQQQQ